MTDTLMYDSIRASGIPKGALLVAGYVDGAYNDFAAIHDTFPKAQEISIDVNGSSPAASVRDWETGDKGGNLEDWVIDHNAHTKTKDAVIYCNRSTISEVRQLTGSQVLNKDYFLWIATGDGTLYGPGTLPGVVACQYSWTPGYDVSLVWPTAGVGWSGYVSPKPPAPSELPPDWVYPPVRSLTVAAVGKTTVNLTWNSPAQPPNSVALPGIGSYEIAISTGGFLDLQDATYPRYTSKTPNPQVWEGGSLGKGAHTAGVRALSAAGHNGSPWATVNFTV
jgi:hypothetical protein